MNREIKFRAWDKETKKMIITGFHVFGEVTLFNIIGEYLYENLCGKDSSLLRYNDVVVTQYLGLKDRNKNEIYEGDIVDEYGELFVVVWDSRSAKFSLQFIYSDDYLSEVLGNASIPQTHKDIPVYFPCTIKGNIFENPELLKK